MREPPPGVDVDDFGCWLWLGAVNEHGYGRRSDRRSAPRVALEEFLGQELPANVFPDHFCRRRRCIRPQHLDPVTQGENERRKSARYRSQLTRCPIGHRLVEPLHTPEGGLICRTCLNAS